MPDPNAPNQQKPNLQELVARHQETNEQLKSQRAEIVHEYPESVQARHIVLHHPEQFPREYERLQEEYREKQKERVNGMEISL